MRRRRVGWRFVSRREHCFLHDGLFAEGGLVVIGVGFFYFIPEITIGHIWWRLGHFLPFSYRLQVLGVVLPHHYG